MVKLRVTVTSFFQRNSLRKRVLMSLLTETKRSSAETIHLRNQHGNMGISMAFTAAMKGYKMVLTMPSYTSSKRRVSMRAFGAYLILTDPTKGMRGTVKKAYELLESTPNAFMLQQFSNPVTSSV